jgi:Acyl-coenzyme A:6-aminopenicillanic acid acyl-transferase
VPGPAGAGRLVEDLVRVGAETAQGRSRWFRLLKRGLLGVLGLVLIIVLLIAWARLAWVASEPELDGTPAILSEVLEEVDGGLELGTCRLERREGLRTMHLVGDPFTLGFANARLTADLIAEQNAQFFSMIHDLIPNWWALTAVKLFVLYRNRNLPDHVPDRQQVELLGIARGGPPIARDTAPDYHMVLNLHAAHDISHMVEDSPLMGCTALVASGEHAADGHLLVGRNFDFEGCRAFDTNRVVFLVEPEGRIPFLSVAWPGFAGVVSGMNREGVALFIHGAKSDTSPGEGSPAALLARRVLEEAHDLTEALDILRKTPIIGTDIFILASRKDGRCVVVEKSRDRFAHRDCGALTAVANHLKTETFADDEANRRYMRTGTSVPREDRMTELLSQGQGPLDARRCAAILRDRRGAAGRDLGLGNRRTLNPLIATHAVIMDVTAGIVWVASPPHQLGAFVAFNVNDFSARLPELLVPEDPMLAQGDYERSVTCLRLLEFGRSMLDADCPGQAEAAARKVVRLDPHGFAGWGILGEALLEQNREGEAARCLEMALAAVPHFLERREEIKALLEESREGGR